MALHAAYTRATVTRAQEEEVPWVKSDGGDQDVVRGNDQRSKQVSVGRKAVAGEAFRERVVSVYSVPRVRCRM